MQDRAIARHGYEVRGGGERLGEVTSGTMSPNLKVGIGCAYVPLALCAIGSELQIIVRGEPHAARVVKTPFL
jgi:glycine cleavage system T protein (aminomethyltransferase)